MFINLLNTKMMKKIFLLLLSGLFCLAVSAQTTDSTLIKEIEFIKKEITELKRSGYNHNAMISKLKKTHQEDMESVSAKLNENSEKNAAADSRLNELKAALDEHMNSSGARIDALEKWTKQMVLIQFILLGILFIILLILIITNRQRIKKEFIKLETKVDNVKESMEVELNQLMKKHEDDLTAIKKDLEDKKK